MEHKRNSGGFTIVEIIVVVVVIAILATITAVIYTQTQIDARDTKIRNAAARYEEAIEIWAANNGNKLPAGGWASPGGVMQANNTCSAGQSGWQNYSNNGALLGSGYSCTVGDVMVKNELLPADLFTSLPNNTRYNSNVYVFMIYYCDAWYLMYSLEAPTDREKAEYDAVVAKCPSFDTTQRKAYGMQALRKLDAT